MKNVIFPFILICTLLLASCLKDKKENKDPGKTIATLHLSKQKPQPGDTIHISYKLDSRDQVTPLEGYYQYFVDSRSYPEDINLTDSAGIWKGMIVVPDSATTLAFHFEQNYKIYNNSNKGYVQPLYDKEGNLLPGSQASHGYYFLSMGDQYEVKNDSALVMMQTDLQNYPELENEWDETFSYFLFESDKEEGEKFINKRVKYYSSKPSLTEKDYSTLNRFYNILKDQKKQDSINLIALEKYPQGQTAQYSLFQKFYQAQDINEKEIHFSEFIEKFKSNSEGFHRDFMINELAGYYAKKNDWEKFNKYSNLLKNKNNKADTFNSLAWKMAEKGENLKKAEELSKQSLELLQQIADEDKPDYWTKNQFRKNRDYMEKMFTDTYAFVLFKQGKIEEAIIFQKKAVADGKNSGYNERYLQFLIAAENYTEARDNAEVYLRTNTATAQSKDYYKEAFLRTGGNEESLGKKIAQLEEEGKQKALENLKLELLNEEAAEFSLINLEGTEISLSSLKGKTVILDFWATWCGPCTASFPGMQMAVDKYKDDENVQFLFVNTMENGPDRNEEVTAFINKHKYTFNVLMDKPVSEHSRNFKTASDYNISGIPTKIIIGPDGKTGFKKVGYGGNNEVMVQELELMIELLNSNVPTEKTKTPVS